MSAPKSMHITGSVLVISSSLPAGTRPHRTFANVPPSAACEQGDPDEREHHRFGHPLGSIVENGFSGCRREEIVSVGVELVDEIRLRAKLAPRSEEHTS